MIIQRVNVVQQKVLHIFIREVTCPVHIEIKIQNDFIVEH